MINIWVISDTHVPERIRNLPEEFLGRVKKNDIILHAGDFTHLEVLRELENKASVFAVCGNMDDQELKKLLPQRRVENIAGFKIGIYHGYGSPFGLAERVYHQFPEDLDVLVFGHSHTSYNKKINSTLLFNAGSLSGDIVSWRKSFGILKIEEQNIWGEIIHLK